MVNIEEKDLYQLLLSECRYGYARNNHLMPNGAYQHVKEYLEPLYKANKSMAFSTATQLIEECIGDQLCMNFSDGMDDDSGNRASALEFIEWLMNWLKEHGDVPVIYNWARYIKNIEAAKKLKYDLVALKPGTFEDINSFDIDKTIMTGLSYDDANNKLMTDVLKTDNMICNSTKLLTDKGRVYGRKFRICQPAEHKDELYGIILTEE